MFYAFDPPGHHHEIHEYAPILEANLAGGAVFG
jgi:hypothetical protein